MNKLYMTGVFVFFSITFLFGQDQNTVTDTIKPKFISDYASFEDYIAGITKFPENARKNCMRGKVVVGFKISSLGNLDEIIIFKNSFKPLDEEAIRVISSTQGKWKAATVNGSPVDYYILTPFNFWFEDYKCEEFFRQNEWKFSLAESFEKGRLFYESGVQKLSNKQYEVALKDFDESLNLTWQDEDAYYNRAICKLKLGDTKGACEDWKKSKYYSDSKGKKEIDLLLDKYCK